MKDQTFRNSVFTGCKPFVMHSLISYDIWSYFSDKNKRHLATYKRGGIFLKIHMVFLS